MSDEIIDVKPIEHYGVPSESMVEKLATILEAGYTVPSRRNNENQQKYEDRIILPHEFPVVVQKAFARGYNPLSNGFHYFKISGSIEVMDHYATLNAWAQEKDPFTYEFFRVTGDELKNVPGATERDFVAKCVIVRRSDRTAYEAKYERVFDKALKYFDDWEKAEEEAQKAVENLAFVGYGLVEYKEVYYEDSGKMIYGATPKGWIPGWTKAETRAFRNAIKRSHGIPSPREIYQMSFGAMGQQNYERLLPNVPEDEGRFAEKYLQLAARAENGRQEREDMTDEEVAARAAEGRAILRDEERGEELGGDWREALYEVEESPEEEGEALREPEEGESRKGLTAGERRERFTELGVPPDGHLDLVNKVLGKSFSSPAQIGELTVPEYWNITQYRARSLYLVDTDNGSRDERLEAIPEIAEADPESRPKTIKDAKAYLVGLARSMSKDGEMMKDFSLVEA